ncbi:MAG: VWA domain-containing protein [Cellvibrionaceae bacterium]
MLEFSLPYVFILIPLPFLVYWLAPRAKQENAAVRVPFFNELQSISQNHKSIHGKNAFSLALMSLLWIASLIAAAGPQWIGDPIRVPTSGRDLLIAVDISGSMQTADMIINDERVDRLTVVKKVVGDFVERRKDDRLGLILFGTQAYLQAPLTFDRKTVNTLLQESRLGFAGEKTAIGDAIGLATKRLLDRPENSRVLILLTDGANTAGEVEPLQAAELASQSSVKIYTIGIGANELVIPGVFGSSFGARSVNPSMDLDEKTLNTIAESTGGQYFRAENTAELERIYNELDILEPQEQEAESYRPINALFYWPLGFAFLLSLLMALTNLWFTRKNNTTNNLETNI